MAENRQLANWETTEKVADFIMKYYDSAIESKRNRGEKEFIIDGKYFNQKPLDAEHFIEKYQKNPLNSWQKALGINLTLGKTFKDVLGKKAVDQDLLWELIEKKLQDKDINIQIFTKVDYTDTIPTYFDEFIYVLFVVLII